MILLVDWGNSRIKWLVVEKLDSKSIENSQLKVADGLLDFLPQVEAHYEQILIASVRDKDDNLALAEALQQHSSQIQFAETQALSGIVENSYSRPESMGVDRWMGIIAAARSNETVAIISIGSAITLDIVKAGKHLGGQIIPGQRLLLESLNKTGRVRPETDGWLESEFSLGQSTNQCVQAGLESLMIGYLTTILRQSEEQHQVDKYVFTGGGGLYWFTRLRAMVRQAEYREFLVFEGLAQYFA